ncbi:hypothetical protein JXA12_02085 [Candidatus Woesearchaeota archaeon]|nr:hypothetical protein [Candidatus Woesearchaeota archaeon]
MGKNMTIILAVMGALLLIGAVGCTENKGPNNNWQPFIGGTQGVTMQFNEYSPPAEVNIDEEFKVTVILENLGEHTVPAGDYFVRVGGFSPKDFNVHDVASDLTVSPDEPLQGNEMNPDTGETIGSYPVYVEVPSDYYLSFTRGIPGNLPYPFWAEVCYTYVTNASAQLCIKEELTKTSDTAVCTLSGPQPITNSGGPVQITEFKEYSGGKDAVRFSFIVLAANAGGKLSARHSGCNDGKSYSDENLVYVTVDTGLDGLSCSGFTTSEDRVDEGSRMAGYVKLNGGSRTVTCTQDLSGQHDSNHVEYIDISAEYDYLQTLETSVLVKNV